MPNLPTSAARIGADIDALAQLTDPGVPFTRRAFTPRRLESLRPRIQAITDRLLDTVEGRGEIDLMRDLAAPLPVTIIAELLGFPAEDYAQIKKWSDEMTEALGFRPSPEQQLRANEARDQISDYFDRLVIELRQNPGDNLISAARRRREAQSR